MIEEKDYGAMQQYNDILEALRASRKLVPKDFNMPEHDKLIVELKKTHGFLKNLLDELEKVK